MEVCIHVFYIQGKIFADQVFRQLIYDYVCTCWML